MSRIFRLSYVIIAAYSVSGTIAKDLLLLHQVLTCHVESATGNVARFECVAAMVPQFPG